MKQIINKRFSNELDKIFHSNIKEQYDLINNLYAKYKGSRMKATSKVDLDMIYKYYLKALMVDMVKHPLAVFSDNHTDIMVPGTYGEDFNLHRIEYIKSIQEYCDTMELGIDVQQFPVSLVNILYKFEYPVAKDGYIKETGVLCNSFLVTLKSYCDNMKYYYEYLFVCRLIQMVIDLDKETYDTIGKESYLYDSILNLIWLLEAIYNNMLLDSKDLLELDVEEEYEN